MGVIRFALTLNFFVRPNLLVFNFMALSTTSFKFLDVWNASYAFGSKPSNLEKKHAQVLIEFPRNWNISHNQPEKNNNLFLVYTLYLRQPISGNLKLYNYINICTYSSQSETYMCLAPALILKSCFISLTTIFRSLAVLLQNENMFVQL